MSPTQLHSFGLFVFALPCILSYRILLYPQNIDSHIQYFGKLGHGLATEGHEVEIIVPSNARIPWELKTKGFTITPYPVKAKESIYNTRETAEIYLNYALAENKILAFFKIGRWIFDKVTEATKKDCEDLLWNFEIMDRLFNISKADFVISDFGMTQCHFVFVKSFQVPYAVLSLPIFSWTLGIPRFPSFVPNVPLALNDKMTFIERLVNLLVELFSAGMFALEMSSSHIPEYLGERTEGYKSMLDFMRNASLYFLLEDLTVSYPSTYTPDVISIGDISAGFPSINALPQNINQFLGDKSAIYMSFGSFINHASEDLIKKFCSSFRILKDLRIIWKLKNTEVCGSEINNVLILSWVPQNELLADPRLKLFITHGGINSMIEAVYHAKPVIVLPLAGDQPAQAKLAEEKGYGIHMDLRYWTPEDLVSNITKMLTDSTYLQKAKHYSEILKQRRDTPAERVSFAIEGALKFGTEHLKTSARDLYWFQFMMFDLFLALLLIVLLVGFFASCALYRMFRFIAYKLMKNHTKLKLT